MNIVTVTAVAALLGSAVASNMALAQQAGNAGGAGSVNEGVTVSASRGNAKPVVSTVGAPRYPVTQVTLTYSISTAGYDLTTATGVDDLKQAVNQTALDVCKEIGRQYPDSTPNDAACASAAAGKAMFQVRKIVAAVNKKADK
jgi:hypothetical protein